MLSDSLAHDSSLHDLPGHLKRGQHTESFFDEAQHEGASAKQPKDSYAEEGNRWSQHFTTIVCRTQLLEYKFSRDQISEVKEKLYEKMKEHAERRDEEARREAREGGRDFELDEYRDEDMRLEPQQSATSIAESNLRF